MDLLIVARESAELQPTDREETDEAHALALIARLPYGQVIAPLVKRLSVAAMVLSQDLDRAGARAAIGVALHRSGAHGIVLLGIALSKDLLGEALPLVGGIRDLHGKPVAGIAQAKAPDIERLLTDLCQRARISWAPPSARAVAARSVVRAEGAETLAARFIEHQQWAAGVEALLAAEPLSARGTNMLGRCLLQLGEREAARHAFERTLAGDPGNAIATRQLEQLEVN